MSKLSLWKTIFFVCVFCAAEVITSPAQTFTTLVNFDGTNGAFPGFMSLVQGADGNFYGTTTFGGTSTVSCYGNIGCGTVFKITPTGTLTMLHSFVGTDGANPRGLVQATDENFYGTTGNGGPHGFGGTVFKITPTGTLTTLYNFCSQTGCADGGGPLAGLVQASNGNFYGTTQVGGANNNAGTVFEITPTGTLTTLYNFCSQTGCTDGFQPFAGALVQASNGNFYGTTPFGGTSTVSCGGNIGCGTVFEITPTGTLTTLHSFIGTDGTELLAALIQAADGNFYGTTFGGGTTYGQNNTIGDGTVFKITPTGTLTMLHSFVGTDGANPDGGLVQAGNGNFYGTTSAGGTNSDGTVFELAVHTPQQATQTIINSVNTLFSQGVLNGGQDNSLVVQLQHAINLMNAGKNAGAIGNLESFISEVNDLLSSGVLSPSQAASLISAAESVIAQLS